MTWAHLPFLLVLVGTVDPEPAVGPPGSQLVIASDSACPSVEAVRQSLAQMRPATDWPTDLVVIRTTPHSLSIDLGRASRRQRQLTMESDCEARATSAALIVATWMDDLPAEGTSAPVLLEPDEEDLEPPLPVRGPAHYEAGAGLSAAAGGGLAPGAYVELVRLRPESDLGWLAGMALAAPREILVDAGVSRFMRTSAAVGAQARKTYQRLLLAADLGLALAYTAAWGSGYAKDKTDGSFNWGPVADLRAGIPWGRLRLWIAARASWWVRAETVQVDAKTPAGSARRDLPHWDGQGLLGLSYLLP
jgi:hypothetical protein